MTKNETLITQEANCEKILESVINNIIELDSSEDSLNEFQKHMKYNITLMNFLKVIIFKTKN